MSPVGDIIILAKLRLTSVESCSYLASVTVAADTYDKNLTFNRQPLFDDFKNLLT